MRIRVLYSTALAALVGFAMIGCQDLASPEAAGELAFARGEGGGGGGGGGGRGRGGDYSELLVLLRDVNGVPITFTFVGAEGTLICVQPITTAVVPDPEDTSRNLATTINPVDGRTVTIVPLFAHYPQFLPPEETVGALSEDEEGSEPCDPLVASGINYADYTAEVDLERLNMVRSPESVLLQHMKELELLLTTTNPQNVTLDPAGRITFDGIAVDAMPKLQGMREALLETGTIPGAGGYPFPFQLVHPNFAHWQAWALSAFAMGGSASKFAAINVDAVAYHDRIMGIPLDTRWAGVHTYSELGERFVDYSAFTYDRATTFPGCVTYLDPDNWAAGYKAQTMLAAVGSTVGWGELAPGAASNIAAYAQMADDVIRIILFIHNFESVIAYADPAGVDSGDYCQTLANELNDDGGEEPPPPPPPPAVDPPVASFTYSCQNSATCSFTDTSTGTVLTWAWTFENAVPSASEAQHPTTAFQAAGIHTVQLTAANGGGAHSYSATVTCAVSGKLRCR